MGPIRNSLSAGAIRHPDGPTFSTTGTTTVDGEFALCAGLTWSNGGVVNLDGTLILATAAGGATFANMASGTLNLAGLVANYSTFDPATESEFDVSGTLSNAGLMTVSGIHDTYVQARLVETGRIRLNSATLSLTEGGVLGGGISGVGTVELAGGAFTLNEPVVTGAATLVLAGGTVSVAAGHTLGALVAVNGEIDGPGTFATTGGVTSLAQLALGGGLTWNNSALVTASGFMALNDDAGAAHFHNLQTGTLALRGAVFAGGDPHKLGSIANAGLITLDAGFSSRIGNVLTETGTIALSGNTLALGGGGTLGGRVAGRGTIALEGGRETVNAVALAAGISLRVLGGTLEVATDSVQVSAGFDVAGGRVRIDAGDTLLVRGPAAFGTGGPGSDLSGPGRLVTLGQTTVGGPAAALTVDGGLTWLNRGTVADVGAIRVGGTGARAATIVNGEAGTFALTTDAAGIRADGGTVGGRSVFLNYGLLTKTGGAHTSADTAATANAGTIEAASGTLAFTSAITGKGVLRIDAGATLETTGIGVNQGVVFDGAGTLRLDVRAAPALPVAGLGAGAAIDLANGAGVTARIEGDTLLVQPLGGRALSFLSVAPLAGLGVVVASDGHAGSLVTLVAGAAASFARELTPNSVAAAPAEQPATTGAPWPTPASSPVLFAHR